MGLVEISHVQGHTPVTIFHLQDRVNLGNFAELEELAKEAYSYGVRDVVIDLSKTPSMTSIGIRALLVIHRMLSRDQGQHLKLASATPEISEMLEIAGVTRATAAPFGVYRSSGSSVRLPTIVTWLSLAISITVLACLRLPLDGQPEGGKSHDATAARSTTLNRTKRLRVRLANDADRRAIYRARHAVYASPGLTFEPFADESVNVGVGVSVPLAGDRDFDYAVNLRVLFHL